MIQIETEEAVQNIDTIAAVDGVGEWRIIMLPTSRRILDCRLPVHRPLRPFTVLGIPSSISRHAS